MKHSNKKMPLREVHISNIKLIGHRAIRADISYGVDSRDRRTWVKQPIEFSMCDAQQLARRFHAIAKELETQLAQFKIDLHGGNTE